MKNSIRANAIAALICKIGTVGFRLVTIPLILWFWSSQKLGEWMIISSVATWLSMSDVGFGAQASNEVTMKHAANEIDEACNILRTSWMCLTAISLAIFLLIIPFFLFTPTADILKIHGFSQSSLTQALIYITFGSLISFQAGLYQGHYRCSGHAALGILLFGSRPLIDLVFLVIGFFSGAQLHTVALMLMIGKCLHSLVFYLIANKICSEINIRAGVFQKSEAWNLTKRGLAFCLLPLGYAILMDGTLLAINLTLGGTVVAVYGTLRTLTRSGAQAVELVKQSVWPKISQLVGSKNYEPLRKLHSHAVFTSFMLSLSIVVFMGIFGSSIYNAWTRGNVNIDPIIMLVLLAALIPNSVWNTSAVVLESSNNHEKFARFFFLASTINVVVVYFFASKIGLMGVSLVGLAVEFAIVAYVVPKSLRLIKQSKMLFFQEMLSMPAMMKKYILAKSI